MKAGRKRKQFNEFARYFVEKKAHEASKLHNTFDTFFFEKLTYLELRLLPSRTGETLERIRYQVPNHFS